MVRCLEVRCLGVSADSLTSQIRCASRLSCIISSKTSVLVLAALNFSDALTTRDQAGLQLGIVISTASRNLRM